MYLVCTLKFLIEEQTQISEQGVLFLKIANRADPNKQAGKNFFQNLINKHGGINEQARIHKYIKSRGLFCILFS